MSTIAELISSKQQEISDAETSKQQEIMDFNRERLAAMVADYKSLFGDLYGEIMAVAKSYHTLSRETYIGDGIVELQSDEMQLAPMKFVWSVLNFATDQHEGHIYCEVWRADYHRYFDFTRANVTLADALFDARQEYPKWRKLEDKKASEAKSKEIGRLVSNMTIYSDDIEEKYKKLQAIDPEIAHSAYQSWRDRMIAEWSKDHWWTANNDWSIVERNYKLFLKADQKLADEKLASYHADIAEQGRMKAKRVAEQGRIQSEIAQWRADCAIWAARETARLWKPFTVVKVCFAPIGYAGPHDEENSAIDFVYCVGKLEDVVAAATAKPGAILDVLDFGWTTTKPFAIGAFLSAQIVADYMTPPGIGGSMKFHASVYAGGSYVNYPPNSAEKPVDPPIRPHGDDCDDIPL